MPNQSGEVILIGAGPGDPGLIPLRGVHWLQRADLVLYDYLVNEEILRHTSPDCENICLGRHGRSSIWPQETINQKLVSESRKGKIVVRLKSGDPMIFGRAADELDALIQNNIPFQIVPGITAALASGSYSGIPITHRDHASAVALITGREVLEKNTSALDFDALARFPGTLVIYMGVTSAEQWSQGLMNAGMPADTPVALIRRCSWPNQQTLRCQLDEVAAALTPYRKFPPPVIAVIGQVTHLADRLSWFEKRPLFGQRVMVTRPAQQAASLCQALAEQGADTVAEPAIEITDPTDWVSVDQCFSRIHEFDWLVFSSANGVEQTMKRLFANGHDVRTVAHLKLATIGPMTSRKLREYGLRTDLEPSEFRAEALAEALSEHATGKRFLLARASRGREILAESLTHAGATVETMVVYSSQDTASPSVETLEQLRHQKIDWVTVTSSAIARSVHRLFGKHLEHTKIASISPVTSATLQELGIQPDCEATTYTMSGLIEAMVNY